MLAMQYTIQLPADYDMAAIDARVEERKPLFDNVAGLAHKSYLANDEDKIYAPFYIWNDITKLRDFLLDDLFHGVTTAFHRPRVRSWAVLEQERGNFTGMPAFAMRESETIPHDEPLEVLIDAEKKRQEDLAGMDGLYLTVLGLDADRWELLRYSLWKDRSSAPETEFDCVQTYRVLHV